MAELSKEDNPISEKTRSGAENGTAAESKDLNKEDDEEREDEWDKAQFQYYLKLAGFGIIGSVFFVTCFIGLLNGLSPKALSFRAIVSTVLSAVFVYLCQLILQGIYSQKVRQKTTGNKES